MNSRLARVEALAAALLSAWAVWLHFVNGINAGPLWRDETNTIGLATLPSLRDVWANLQYDSFPVLWVAFVRELAAVVGPMNDAAFRVTGLIIGLSIVVMLWVTARTFGSRYPLIALALFALNPSVIRWGDSLRAYGAGITLELITAVLLWRFVSAPSRRRFAAALFSAVLSVNTLYYNAPALFALCAGATAVCVLRRDLRTGTAVIGVGALAALSMTPYAVTIRQAASWNALVQIPDYDLTWFVAKLGETLSVSGTWAAPVWIVAFFLAAWAGIRELLGPGRLGLKTIQREVALFGVTTLLTGALALFVFLRVLSYVTQPWYYLTLLSTVVLGLEIISGALINHPLSRKVRLAAVAAVAGASLLSAPAQLRVRMTNADIVARTLSSRTVPGDLIISNPWYMGVSLERYYDGDANLMTLPALGFTRFQRFDLVKVAMQQPSQWEPVTRLLDAVATSLKSGHSVFVVGGLPSALPDTVIALPAARLPDEGWRAPQYQRQWAEMVARFIQTHAARNSRVALARPERISGYEDLQVYVATGWRE